MSKIVILRGTRQSPGVRRHCIRMSQEFTWARLTPQDAKCRSDSLLSLRDLILQKEDLYPEIGKWFDERVIAGLIAQARVAYVGYLNGLPAAAGIIKLGAHAKVCHISIREDLQNVGLGEALLSLLMVEARNRANTVYLTLPESLWDAKTGFFRSFGFVKAHVSANQYRLSNRELVIRAKFPDVWRAVLNKIAKICRRFSLIENPSPEGVLFSVLPEFAEMIVRGIKTVEVRRRFSERWAGQRAVLYATKVSAVLGEAKISCVRTGTPESIWNEYGSAIRCTQNYYDSYVNGCKTVYAICLKDVTRYAAPVRAATLTRYIGSDILAPRSYIHLRNESKWSEAVNISQLLQCLYQSVSISDSTRLASKALDPRT